MQVTLAKNHHSCPWCLSLSPVSWPQVRPMGNAACLPCTCVTVSASGSCPFSSSPSHVTLMGSHDPAYGVGEGWILFSANWSTLHWALCDLRLFLSSSSCYAGRQIPHTAPPQAVLNCLHPPALPPPQLQYAAFSQLCTFLFCLNISTFPFGVVWASGSETLVNIKITWNAPDRSHRELDAAGLGGPKKEVREETCFVRFHLVLRMGLGHQWGSHLPRQSPAYKPPFSLGRGSGSCFSNVTMRIHLAMERFNSGC